MAQTLKQAARTWFEMSLVEAVPCLDCGAPRHVLCYDKHGRQSPTCCQAREDFGEPILLADLRCKLLLKGVA
jgi:hypothetical protein